MNEDNKVIKPEEVVICANKHPGCLQVKNAYFESSFTNFHTKNVDFTYYDPDHNWTSLMAACQEGHYELVKHILANGGIQVINRRDRDGWTALMMACFTNQIKVVKLLLAHSADVSILNKDQRSAISVAAHKDHFQVVELLLQYGASAEQVDTWGVTVLELSVFAMYYCRRDALQLMLHNEVFGDYHLRRAMETAVYYCCAVEAACLSIHGAFLSVKLAEYLGKYEYIYKCSNCDCNKTKELIDRQSLEFNMQICPIKFTTEKRYATVGKSIDGNLGSSYGIWLVLGLVLAAVTIYCKKCQKLLKNIYSKLITRCKCWRIKYQVKAIKDGFKDKPINLVNVLNALEDAPVGKHAHVGLALGLDMRQINVIEANHPGNVERVWQEIIQWWLSNSLSLTWTALAQILVEEGFSDVVRRFAILECLLKIF